jgi:molecular chaperone GrpE
MAEQRQGGSPEREEPQVKVTDRRRFRLDGGPAEPAEETAPPASEPANAGPTAEAPRAVRDETLAAQAARIDELSRAYAALVEDNKAFRQRLEREKGRVLDAERASLAQSLLEATDDLERALAAVSGTGDAQGGQAHRTLVDGVRLSLGGLHQRIAQLGAERLAVAGQRFDPHVAEAVDTVAISDEAQDGVVVQEVRAGWRIGDRVLRPARVRVGRIARA